MNKTTRRDRDQAEIITVGGDAASAGRAEPAMTQEVVRRQVSVTINGRARAMDVEPRTTLLDALRDEPGLTGTKKGCDRGECGACTVHVEGRRILSCMTLAMMQEGKRITLACRRSVLSNGAVQRTNSLSTGGLTL